jgi:hypothetical protein
MDYPQAQSAERVSRDDDALRIAGRTAVAGAVDGDVTGRSTTSKRMTP